MTYKQLALPDVPIDVSYGQQVFLMQLKRALEWLDTALVSRPTFTGLAPKWNDLRFPAIAQQAYTVAGRIDFNFSECSLDFQDNALYPDDPMCALAQFPHGKLLGSNVYPHIHWIQNQDAVPNWLLAIRWYNRLGDPVPSAWTLFTVETTSIPYTSGSIANVSKFNLVNPHDHMVTEHISSFMDIRLFRDTSNVSGLFSGADPYTGTVQLKEFDIHYQIDSLGSDEQYIKQ